MKFTRRPDLDPQARIEMVKDVWMHQGLYGKMTQMAQAYHISRTFLYQLSWAASTAFRMFVLSSDGRFGYGNLKI